MVKIFPNRWRKELAIIEGIRLPFDATIPTKERMLQKVERELVLRLSWCDPSERTLRRRKTVNITNWSSEACAWKVHTIPKPLNRFIASLKAEPGAQANQWADSKILRRNLKNVGYKIARSRVLPEEILKAHYFQYGLYSIKPEFIPLVSDTFGFERKAIPAKNGSLVLFELHRALPHLVAYAIAQFKRTFDRMKSPKQGLRELREHSVRMRDAISDYRIAYRNLFKVLNSYEDVAREYWQISDIFDKSETLEKGNNLYPPLPTKEDFLSTLPAYMNIAQAAYRAMEDAQLLDYGWPETTVSQPDPLLEEPYLVYLEKQFDALIQSLSEIPDKGGQRHDFMKRALVENLKAIFDHFSLWWRAGWREDAYRSRRNDFLQFCLALAGESKSRNLLSRSEMFDHELPIEVRRDLIPHPRTKT